MAQGNYGTSSNPLSELFAEQIVLTPRTSDPASPSQGDMWLRTDLSSGDKIATVRWQSASGTQDIPVFGTSQSTDSKIKKVLRIQTPNGLGFIPTYEGGGTYSELGLQHGGARHGLHDSLTVTAIPSSGVARWTFDDADTSGGNAIDVWQNNDAPINGATTGVSGHDGEAYSLDGTNDWVGQLNTGVTTAPLSWSVWLTKDSTTSLKAAIDQGGNRCSIQYEATGSNGIEFNIYDGSSFATITGGDISGGSWHHLVATYDGSTMEFYVDNVSQGTASVSQIGQSSTAQGIGAGNGGSKRYWDGDIDDPRQYSKRLSDSEIDNLYNTGSISG